MPRLQLDDPSTVSMEEAVAATWRDFECEPLGGPSDDGWSRMSDFQRCPYRYYLRYERQMRISAEGLQSRTAGVSVGGLTHVMLALHYGRYLPEGYPGWRRNLPQPDAFLDQVIKNHGDIHYVEATRRLYYGYVEHYNNEVVQPVAIEYGAGAVGIHTCRYDMLAWENQALWNFEHKTSFRPTPEVLEGWWLDGEILGEIYGWHISQLEKVFQGRLTGVVVNILFKTNPPTYHRIQIVVPERVMEEYARDRARWAEQREEARRTGIWPRKLQGCLSRYDMCTYWSHCRDANDDILVPLEVRK